MLSENMVYASIITEGDGQLSGVGSNLADFLKHVQLVNCLEIGSEAEIKKEGAIICHGFGDMVARYIREFKDDGCTW